MADTRSFLFYSYPGDDFNWRKSYVYHGGHCKTTPEVAYLLRVKTSEPDDSHKKYLS